VWTLHAGVAVFFIGGLVLASLAKRRVP